MMSIKNIVPSFLLRKPKPPIDFSEAKRKRFAIPMGGNRVLCSVLDKHRMFVDANDYDISPHILMDGVWEEHISNVIMNRLRPGMITADIGANVGYFTILMAHLCGSTGHVLSFEPNPRSFEILRDNVLLNGISERVTVCQSPLGDEDGKDVVLAVSHYHPGGAQLTYVPGSETETYNLTTLRLDSVPKCLGAALVKIDTEGSEYSVWRGMSALLHGAELRYVIIEFTRLSYVNPKGFLEEIVSFGFAIYWIRNDTGELVVMTPDTVLAGPGFQMLLLER